MRGWLVLRSAAGAAAGLLIAQRDGYAAGPPAEWLPDGSLRKALVEYDCEEWSREMGRRPERRKIRLLLIRHAEARTNVNPEFVAGQSNAAPLTDRGVRQAHALGRRLRDAGVRFDAMYSSTAVRARETARIACEEMGVPAGSVVAVPDVLEVSQGEFTGRRRSDVYTPERLRDVQAQLMFFRPPGADDGAAGESQHDAEKRLVRFIDKLVEQPAGGSTPTIAVFMHGLAIRCFVRHVLGAGPTAAIRTHTANTSITEVLYVPKVGGDFNSTFAGWHVVRMGDSAHLQGGV